FKSTPSATGNEKIDEPELVPWLSGICRKSTNPPLVVTNPSPRVAGIPNSLKSCVTPIFPMGEPGAVDFAEKGSTRGFGPIMGMVLVCSKLNVDSAHAPPNRNCVPANWVSAAGFAFIADVRSAAAQ